MIDKNKEVQVTNRSRGVVGYTIPELGGLRRQYQKGETKTVTFNELQHLSWLPGGMNLLKDELVVRDEEIVEELLHGVEPEYYYTEQDVKYLLTSGDYNQLLDCLDFAPNGVLELVKKYAVELPCNDVAKRDAIYQKLGFDVTKAIDFAKDGEESTADTVTTRRAAPVAAGKTTTTVTETKTRTAAPVNTATDSKYKVTK